MQLAITFKQMESSDALKSYAQEKLDKLDKMLDAPGRQIWCYRLKNSSYCGSESGQ